jgi:hypothetical protein
MSLKKILISIDFTRKDSEIFTGYSNQANEFAKAIQAPLNHTVSCLHYDQSYVMHNQFASALHNSSNGSIYKMLRSANPAINFGVMVLANGRAHGPSLTTKFTSVYSQQPTPQTI